MNLIQFLLILRARIWIVLSIFLVAVTTTTLVTVFLLPNQYTATTTVVVDSKAKDPFTGQLLPIQLLPGYMATQADIIMSRRVALKVVDKLKMADGPDVHEQFMEATKGKGDVRGWLAGVLQEKLDVQPGRESSVIEIGFQGVDPKFAALIANAFAQSYIETSLDLRIEPAKQTAEWFDQQITQLRVNLEAAQAKLSAYQLAQGIVESDERLDVESRRLSELASQVISAKSATYDSASRVGQTNALPEVINNPVVQNLKAQLAQVESQLADLSKKMGTNHPQYRSLDAERLILRDKLAHEITTATRGVSATASAARQRESNLASAYEEQKKRVLGLKSHREEATLLARDVQNAQQIYDAALQRYGQTRMEAQSTQTDLAILNPAIPPTKKSSPKTFLNIALSAVIGLILGIALAFVLEMLDRRVRSGLDIAGELGIPVLAELGGSDSWISLLRRKLTRSRLLRA